ncbi:MAG: hypothetical protein AABW83_02635 [Nanoarchaeota archaeon]
MKKRIFVLMVVSVLFFLNFVSAGVYFSEVNSKYNLGDMIDFNVKVDPIHEGLLLNVKLYCSSNFVIEFNNLPSSDGKVNIKLPLNFNTINRANGDCHFTGFYNGEKFDSINFEISKLLIVKLNNDAFFARPNEEIIISGSAEKINGNSVNGEVEIKIPLLEALKLVEEKNEISNIQNNSENQESEDNGLNDENNEENLEYNAGIFYGRINDGKFSVSIKIPEDTPAGDFRIDILVYEKSGEEKTSEGVGYANLKVSQIIKGIELNLNTQNFDPGTIIELKPKLLDQTGININEEVSVVIRNSLKERFYEKIVKSEEGISYEIPKNTPSGYYEIEASANSLNVSKSFFVNEKAIVSFDLVNDTLIVSNIGNIPYDKNIEIELNGKPFIKSVNLELTESTNFKLTGSQGEYNVKVRDGDNEFVKSGVSLTGKVVNVNAVGEGINLNSPVFWIFFFIILILILLFLFRSVFKKRSTALHSFKPLENFQGGSGGSMVNSLKSESFSKEKSEDKKPVILRDASEIRRLDFRGNTISNKADQVMVMSGDKSKVAVLVVKIKNKLGKNEKKVLEQAIESVYSKKGAVYEQGDFVFVIFSPLMTKTENNEQTAVLSAQNIYNILSEYNKKFKEVIEFGIAVNSGDIINKIENGKLKFTALGNIFISAKRLVDISNRNVLLTKDSFQRMGSQIKADKINDNAYLLRNIVDAEKNSKFIKGFLERQNK